MKTVRRPPYPKWNPGYFPCSSLTPLPLSSRRPSVSFGGFGLTGSELELNYETSAFGGVRVEVQDESRRAIPGYALDDCPEFFGDRRIEGVVSWEKGADVSALEGRAVRLRFELKDADVYSFRFR